MAVLRCMGCMREYNERKRRCPYCGYDKVCRPDYSFCLMPETILQGRYIVGKTLKYGEQEIIYMGWDQILEKRIAVKEYFPQQLLNRMEGEKLTYLKETGNEKEFQSGKKQYIADALELAKFREETGVIRIYDYFEENGTVYVITEYSENYGKDDVATRLLYSKKRKKKRTVRYVWYCAMGIETVAVALILLGIMIRQQQSYPFLDNKMTGEEQRIPDVVGENYEQAKQELENLGLAVHKENYLTNAVEEGLVLQQSMDWGIEVQSGTDVTLIVSKEKMTETVTTENNSSEEKSSVEKSTQMAKNQKSTTREKTPTKKKTKNEKTTETKKKTNQATTEKATEVIVIED